MNLATKLKARAAAGKPVRIALIGAGKFGTMFLAQARLTPGLHVAGLADLDPARARQRFLEAGWPAGAARSARCGDRRRQTGGTCITDDAERLIASPEVEVVIEATGDPGTGIRLALIAIDHGKHLVMVNVEADALAGPLLAAKARRARARLQPRLGRPAGPHRRARRLGARLRLQRRCRRQGHALPPVLSRPDARHRVGRSSRATSRSATAATSTRRCSIPSSTAPSPPSR